jgi:hypothetical protein
VGKSALLVISLGMQNGSREFVGPILHVEGLLAHCSYRWSSIAGIHDPRTLKWTGNLFRILEKPADFKWRSLSRSDQLEGREGDGRKKLR